MMQEESTCPVCFGSLKSSRSDPERGVHHFYCQRCGKFSATEEALSDVLSREELGTTRDPTPGPKKSRKRAELSGWLQDHQGVLLTTELVQDTIRKLSPFPVPEIVDRALLRLARETSVPGSPVNVNTPSWLGLLRIWTKEDLLGWVNLLRDFRYIKKDQLALGLEAPVPVRISAHGWQHLEDLRETNPDSAQGFVAMWFDEAMTEVYFTALAPGIEAAGYRPHRVDQREFTGRIDDEIVAQIRRSRFVVADFSGHRGGVYWEAGLAEGLGLPVVFTCREDHLQALHFDVRQNNTIVWAQDNLTDLRQRLQARIEAVLGRGPLPPPSKES